MKNKDLIKLLREYPEDADVRILGWQYDCEYLCGVEVSFDEKCNEFYLEGVEE